jgi:hypothetical protein
LLQKLLTPDQLSGDKRLLISKLLAEKKTDDAATALEAYVAQKTTNPDDLYLMARVSPRPKTSATGPVGYYKRALETDPTYQPALYDLGAIQLEAVGVRRGQSPLLAPARGQPEPLGGEAGDGAASRCSTTTTTPR